MMIDDDDVRRSGIREGKLGAEEWNGLEAIISTHDRDRHAREREREERVSCATGRGRGEERDAHEDRIDRPREAVRR